ncbi:MAG: hypothetical protein QW046_05735 [Candidatus Micrarchaeaceae archaeon]
MTNNWKYDNDNGDDVYYNYYKPLKFIPDDNNGTFHSGFQMPKEYPVKVPSKIFLVCLALAKKDTSNEFAIILKGSFTDNGFVVSEDMIVPEQEVSGSSVDFDNVKLQEYTSQGYNTVIHFHPMKMSTFSDTDDKYINSHFQCSILFNDSEFTDCIVNLKIGNVPLQVKGKVSVNIGDINVDTSKIKPKKYTVPIYGNTYGINNDSKEVK